MIQRNTATGKIQKEKGEHQKEAVTAEGGMASCTSMRAVLEPFAGDLLDGDRTVRRSERRIADDAYEVGALELLDLRFGRQPVERRHLLVAELEVEPIVHLAAVQGGSLRDVGEAMLHEPAAEHL